MNGRSMIFAFDTAAVSAVLSPSAARLASIQGGTRTIIRGAGGVEAATRSAAVVEVAGAAPGQRIAVIESAGVDRAASAAGAHLDGVIGPAALRLRSLAIDYPLRRIWFNPALQGTTTSVPRCS
ncbi:MAG TPA: hypothetical protein VFW39_08380 [Sphingomicrobium sp.]|nr:hypothetical protein [Sphingomicrobium sp.]